MKKALIVYHSRTGTTRKLGHEIGNICYQNDVQTEILSIYELEKDTVDHIDIIFLGCWTSGLMVFAQHPEKQWVNFADLLPALNGKQIVLFTTYKLAAGRMFKKMRRHIRCESDDIILEIKSRKGNLSESDAVLLKNILSN